jgi:hypothetical protein
MFVSEIIPNLWVCDYDVANSHYFNNRNIGVYIHIYSFQNDLNINIQKRIGYNQEFVDIQIKEINQNMHYSQNSTIQRQIMRYSKDFADQIYNNINLIHDTLKYRRGVVIFSKHGIQKASTVAAGYLLSKGDMNADSSVIIMKSKEPLFFKDIKIHDLYNDSYNDSNTVLYKNTLKYIESLS